MARGSSVSRGEALSPQTATESMARGVLSAPLSIILPPRLSLSTRSLALFLSHSFIYTVSFFLLSLTLLDSLSNPVFPPCFCIPLPFPQMSSFPLGPPTLLRLQSPSSPPSVLHTFTFPTCCFSSPPLLHSFHLYLPPLCAGFKYEGVFKSSFRLTKQTRWKNNATAHFRLQKEKHISWSITPTESDLSLKDLTKEKGRKISISKGTRSPGGKAKFEKNFLKVCDVLRARTVRQRNGKWRQGRGLRNGCQLSPPSGARCSATHGTLKGPVPPFTAILYICNQGKWFTASTTDNN